MRLHELTPAPGSRRSRKRVGRGIAAGQGKTSGRGQKGQGSRSSDGLPVGFEGGQMRLAQRLPKLRGFHNRFRVEYTGVNLSKLNRFEPESTVDPGALIAAGLLGRRDVGVKVLGAGRLKVKLTLRVHRISGAARAAVEKLGGSVELLEAPAPRGGRHAGLAVVGPASRAPAPPASTGDPGAADDEETETPE